MKLVAEYAAQRGVSPQAVLKAIGGGAGRIGPAASKDDRGRWQIDVALADRLWEERTDPSRQPPAADVAPDDAPADYHLARARREAANAELAEIELMKQRGELILAADVRRKLTDRLSVVRGRMLAIPAAAKQAIPTLSVPDVARLESLVRDALTEIVESAQGEP